MCRKSLAQKAAKHQWQGKAHPDSSTRERRLLQGRVHSWQQELDKEREARGDEDRRTEGRQAIGNLQIEDPKREEIPKENRHWQEERDAPTLKRSRTMLQTEGSRTSPITGSRSCPTITRGTGGGMLSKIHYNLPKGHLFQCSEAV